MRKSVKIGNSIVAVKLLNNIQPFLSAYPVFYSMEYSCSVKMRQKEMSFCPHICQIKKRCRTSVCRCCFFHNNQTKQERTKMPSFSDVVEQRCNILFILLAWYCWVNQMALSAQIIFPTTWILAALVSNLDQKRASLGNLTPLDGAIEALNCM